MKHAVLLAAFSLLPAIAGAVTLTNTDKEAVEVRVMSESKKEIITLKPGEVYENKGKAAHFLVGKEKVARAKADDKLTIKNGKIEGLKPVEKAATPAPKPAKTN